MSVASRSLTRSSASLDATFHFPLSTFQFPCLHALPCLHGLFLALMPPFAWVGKSLTPPLAVTPPSRSPPPRGHFKRQFLRHRILYEILS